MMTKKFSISLFLSILLTLIPFGSYAQNVITGKVVDEGGLPVIGASVIEKGTSNGSVTDMDGAFTLRVHQGATLSFSCIGYVGVEAAASSNMTVVMNEENLMLDELVVVGYGVQKKSSLTGAISSVKADDLENRTITNAQEALQGKVAGVNLVTTDASPGASSTIRIRGISSNASTDPLYVVDGVRTSGIDDLDPNVIESMEVLKDGASAAIYGAEAGNGVILITTKKGSKGKTKISYDFQYASQSLGHTPELLNAKEYVEYMLESGALSQAAIDGQWDGKTDTNWFKEAFENSKIVKHTLSLQGGNKDGNYFLSLGYNTNDGIVTGDKDYYKRLTATINADYRIRPWLTVGTTNNLSKSDRSTLPTTGNADSILKDCFDNDPLTKPFYSENELPANMQTALGLGYNLLKNEDGLYYGIPLADDKITAVERVAVNNNTSTDFRMQGTIYGNLTPINGLTITSRFGYTLGGTRSTTVNIPYYAQSNAKRDFLTMNSQNRTSISYQWENFANYSHTWADAHTLTAMVGMSFQKSSTDYTKGSLDSNNEDALTQNDPLFWYLNYASSSSTKSVDGEELTTTKLSYFGRLGYDYKGKYLLQATLRADAADLSYLPLATRWGYFPSVSAGWTVSREPFFEPVKDVISFMKVRLSWGQNGSLASLGNYKYSTDITNSGYYPLDPNNLSGTITAYPSSMGNDELRWETSEQFDAGLDMRFLQDRLTLGADYFVKLTKDLLIDGVKPSYEIGGTTSPINAGDVRNNGLELELSWRDRIGSDFNYGIRANIATLHNIVTYIDPSLTRIEGARWGAGAGGTVITYFEKGYPIYYFRGFRFAGIDQETGFPLYWVKDENGEDVTTMSPSSEDKEMLGKGMPDATYGITLDMSYKGFDFTVFGTGAFGNDIWMVYTKQDGSTLNRLKKVWFENRWTPENKTGATVPVSSGFEMGSYCNSSAMIFSGSYFRIKQIQLGYTFPRKVLDKIFLNKARVFCSLEDFFTFTKYPGTDPVVAASNSVNGMGVDQGAYPSSKRVVFGINVEF